MLVTTLIVAFVSILTIHLLAAIDPRRIVLLVKDEQIRLPTEPEGYWSGFV